MARAVRAEPTPAQVAGLAHKVSYVLGKNELERDDAIGIDGLRGDRARLEEGGTYCVWGSVWRKVAVDANLMLWNANGENAVDEPRMVLARPGEQPFAFRFRIVRLGDLHLSLYPRAGGRSLGGLYFHPAP